MLKIRKITIIALLILQAVILASCKTEGASSERRIYLFGEQHTVQAHLDKQFELWSDFYHNDDMRHLFVEMPYFSCEFLNIWMKADNDEILDMLFEDASGSALASPNVKEFISRIKKELPETIFHGTDVGHQINTGQRFLEYLRNNGLEESEIYRLTMENIEQGEMFYNEFNQNHSSRAEMMYENFVRTFESLKDENIMSAFYGMGNVAFGHYPDYAGGGPTLAQKLKERYGKNVHTVNLQHMISEELAVADTIVINGKEYRATYFGEREFNHEGLAKMEFWRIEDASDLKNNPLTGDILPYDYYLMAIEIGQIFAIRLTFHDGNTIMSYQRSNGTIWNGVEVTEDFLVE